MRRQAWFGAIPSRGGRALSVVRAIFAGLFALVTPLAGKTEQQLDSSSGKAGTLQSQGEMLYALGPNRNERGTGAVLKGRWISDSTMDLVRTDGAVTRVICDTFPGQLSSLRRRVPAKNSLTHEAVILDLEVNEKSGGISGSIKLVSLEIPCNETRYSMIEEKIGIKEGALHGSEFSFRTEQKVEQRKIVVQWAGDVGDGNTLNLRRTLIATADPVGSLDRPAALRFHRLDRTLIPLKIRVALEGRPFPRSLILSAVNLTPGAVPALADDERFVRARGTITIPLNKETELRLPPSDYQIQINGLPTGCMVRTIESGLGEPWTGALQLNKKHSKGVEIDVIIGCQAGSG